MPDADREPEVDYETRKVDMNLTYSMYYGMFIFLCSGLLTYFVGKYWQKAGDLSRLVISSLYQCIEPVLLNIPILRRFFGGKYKQELLFVPDADSELKVGISEAAIFRFLLNEETMERIKGAEVEIPAMLEILTDIDKDSLIIEVEIHKSSMGPVKDWSKAFHVFFVFKTSETDDGDYWWSLEKDTKYIILQRSRNKENVKDKLDGKQRKKVELHKKDLAGKGTIRNLFALLWFQKLIPEKYNIFYSNCQSFVNFVSKRITEEEYEYKELVVLRILRFFKYSPPPESGRDKKMLDLINILTGPNSSEWHPLFYFILLGNPHLFDKFIKNGKYDINAIYNKLNPLHFAIMYSKTKMVEHFLKHPLNAADPTTRDQYGRDALHWAAMFAMKAEIFNLLLAHDKVKVDNVDEYGKTALQLAASVSNEIAIKKLIENGADPDIAEKNGITPLHLAAENEETTNLIDAILKTGKFDINGVDSDGRTPLHYAINRPHPVTINAHRLIKMGADPGIADKNGVTPLHMAARNAESMDLIGLLLNSEALDVNCVDKQGRTPLACAGDNKHGLGPWIIECLRESGAYEWDPLSIKLDTRKSAILGKGAKGIVWRGEWNRIKVAVKRVEREIAELDVQNNKGETNLQKLNHSNVVKLYHVESDSDFRYCALELCHASLDQIFLDETNMRKYRGPMPPAEEVCLQLAKGLAYIHEKRLNHRYIKPKNILIWMDSRQEKVVMKWSVFGLKQVNERGSHSVSGMRGTLNWYSPEILKMMMEEIYEENEAEEMTTSPNIRQSGTVKNDVSTKGLVFGYYLSEIEEQPEYTIIMDLLKDNPNKRISSATTSPNIRQRGTVKSNVFSAGLVFGYYLLGGDHPFGSLINVLQKILNNDPVNLKKIKEHPMHAIIMDMLKDNPDERISSAEVVSRISRVQRRSKNKNNVLPVC